MDNLIEQYKILHKKDKSFGTTSVKFKSLVKSIIDEIKPEVVLDYGCGKATLSKELDKEYDSIFFDCYDPAIAKYKKLSKKIPDLILCIDVLEHIPEEELKSILSEIKGKCKKVFFAISLRKAYTILPNGENAHCTVKNRSWWIHKIKKYYNKVQVLQEKENDWIALYCYNK